MPRYDTRQLTLMAQIVSDDDVAGGESSLRLYVGVALRTGMEIQAVRERILEMAECDLS